jgi:hypothetical protein
LEFYGGINISSSCLAVCGLQDSHNFGSNISPVWHDLSNASAIELMLLLIIID